MKILQTDSAGPSPTQRPNHTSQGRAHTQRIAQDTEQTDSASPLPTERSRQTPNKKDTHRQRITENIENNKNTSIRHEEGSLITWQSDGTHRGRRSQNRRDGRAHRARQTQPHRQRHNRTRSLPPSKLHIWGRANAHKKLSKTSVLPPRPGAKCNSTAPHHYQTNNPHKRHKPSVVRAIRER